MSIYGHRLFCAAVDHALLRLRAAATRDQLHAVVALCEDQREEEETMTATNRVTARAIMIGVLR